MFKKINGFDVFLVLGIAALIGLFIFSEDRSNQRPIEKIEVRFLSNNNHFLTQEMVNNLLIQNFPSGSTITKETLDLNKLEQELQRNQMIASSEVYLDVDGVLRADVVQKTAAARVLRNGDSFYLDTNGDTMSLSRTFSAHVPVVVGELESKNKANFTHLLGRINTDEMLKTSVSAIKINPNQTLELLVRDYDYTVEFGGLKEIDRKLNNYKAFVQHAQKDTLIDYYTNVNLRFTEQVICTK